MAHLWTYWDARRGEAPIMDRAEFDAHEFRHLLGRINLVNIEPGRPTRFRFRLYGSAIDAPLYSDMTTRTVGDMAEPRYADMIQRSYLQAVRLCRPVFTEVKADLGDGYLMHYCRLALPMSAGTGDFDMLLTASLRYGDDRRRQIAAGSTGIGQSNVFRYSAATPELAHRWIEPGQNGDHHGR